MQNDDDKSKIIEVSRQLSELMIKKDTSAINKIVDPAFTLTHITGYLQPRAEWFAEIESESMKYYSYQEVKTSVDINGIKATFVGHPNALTKLKYSNARINCISPTLFL